MALFEEFPLLTLFVTALVALIVISALRSKARLVTCGQCGTLLPKTARFCSRCGRAL